MAGVTRNRHGPALWRRGIPFGAATRLPPVMACLALRSGLLRRRGGLLRCRREAYLSFAFFLLLDRRQTSSPASSSSSELHAIAVERGFRRDLALVPAVFLDPRVRRTVTGGGGAGGE